MAKKRRTEFVEIKVGRPRKVVNQKEAVERAEMYVAKNLAKYLKKLEELAMGVTVMKESKKGEPMIYVEPPDRQALEYLIDRGMGKSPQSFEVKAGHEAEVPLLPWAPHERLGQGDIVDGEAKEIKKAEAEESEPADDSRKGQEEEQAKDGALSA